MDVKDACKYDQELTSTGAVIAGVAANPNAFGYASLSAVDDTVKAVTVEGVAASEATVQDGTYKIQRPFVFVTKDGAELKRGGAGVHRLRHQRRRQRADRERGRRACCEIIHIRTKRGSRRGAPALSGYDSLKMRKGFWI